MLRGSILIQPQRFSRRAAASLPLRRCASDAEPPPSAGGRRVFAAESEPRSHLAKAADPLVRTSSSSSHPPTSFKELIETLIGGSDLSEKATEASLDLLLREGNEALISAFLVLLRAKGETYEEMVGLARAMIKRCTAVQGLEDAVDIVGTGGDGADTVNISTGACVLAAAAGARVAKQGNRPSSSACGSADIL